VVENAIESPNVKGDNIERILSLELEQFNVFGTENDVNFVEAFTS